MKRFPFVIAVAVLMAACSKQEPPLPQTGSEKPAAPAVQKPDPAPVAQKRTPIPAAEPAEPSSASTLGGKTDDIETDAVNLDNLSQPLVVKDKKPDAEKPAASSK